MALSPQGRPDAPVLLLLEAPDRHDLAEGHYLTRHAGRMVWGALSKAGIAKSDVQILSCYPDGSPDRRGLAPGLAYDFLDEQLRSRTPQIIVPLGGVALTFATGLSPIMDVPGKGGWRGYVVKPQKCALPRFRRALQTTWAADKRATGCTKKKPCHTCVAAGDTILRHACLVRRKGDPRTRLVWMVAPPLHFPRARYFLPTIDPATVRKSGWALLPVLHADLARVGRALRGELTLVGSSAHSDLTSPLAAPELVLDIEGYGKSELIGLADDKVVYSIPSDDAAGREHVSRSLAAAKTLVLHNAGYDYPVLDKEGFPVQHLDLWDTMLATYMLMPDGKKSLNWAISLYLDAERHKHLAEDNWRTYNALDVDQTRALKPILRAGLANTGQLQFFETAMMPSLKTLIGMNTRGIRVDSRAALDLSVRTAEATIKLRQSAIVGNSIRSPLVLAKRFGVRDSEEETLLKLRAQDKFVAEIDEVLRYRALVKLRNTYLAPLVTDPIVRPSYLPGARDSDSGNKGIAYSGRPTASHPNIQNQPAEVRKFFLADNNHVVVSLDWSQIEPRITAALSRDDVMAADIEVGLYDAVARALSIDRDTAKTTVLLSAYLGGPKTLQGKLLLAGHNKTLAECKALQAGMFGRYRGWARWRDAIIREAAEKRALTNCMGKWAPFIRLHPAKAVNFNPQSVAGCILWHCLHQVERAIAPLGARILLTVHDEIALSAPSHMWQAAAAAAKAVMEQEWPQVAPGFRVPVKVKVGPNWGELKAADSFWAQYT